jgi:hypothetical protein
MHRVSGGRLIGQVDAVWRPGQAAIHLQPRKSTVDLLTDRRRGPRGGLAVAPHHFSKLLSDLVVFSADLVLAIEPLEPADRKMTTGHLLEVLDERIA